ncbi:MAG TPA: DNA repair protein RecN [Limnochordia bacterium]|nr:DNA repair protein RecN [Limnochordia bacterium]
MLNELQIRNFALIEELELSFYSGFSVLSGETGAGKSIIIDALGLLLGARASAEMIRTGAEGTRVSGSFSHNASSTCLVTEWGMLEDDDLVITREINSGGRNKCWINGHLATVGQLAQLGPCLVDIVGQHDSQSLLNPQGHAALLDVFGGTEHLALLNRTNTLATEWSSLRSELNRLQGDERERNRRIDLLMFQIEEIAGASLQPGEDERLETERSRLANLDRIRQALHFVLDVMGENYDEREPLLHSLSAIETELRRASTLDTALQPLTQRYTGLSLELHDVYGEFREYLDQLPADPGRLNEVESRLELLDGLKRKYGSTVEDILTYYQGAEEELSRLENATVRADGLEQQSQLLQEQWFNEAQLLTENRQMVSSRLEKQIEKELADLSMDSTKFRVNFVPKSANTPGQGGKEELEFMMAPNIGEDLKPLAKIASGGELSRVMLALKAILIEAEQTPTVIFDEIDAGIGGRTAVCLGEKLQVLSEVRQVLCVTHLPVVASFGRHHYSVQKSSQGERTTVSVHLLKQDERVEELTRMLGGSTDELVTFEHARELLKRTGSAPS